MKIKEGMILGPNEPEIAKRHHDVYFEMHSTIKYKEFYRIDQIISYDVKTKELIAKATCIVLPELEPKEGYTIADRIQTFDLNIWEAKKFKEIKKEGGER